MASKESRDDAVEFIRASGLPYYELEGWLPIDLGDLLDRIKERAASEAYAAGFAAGFADGAVVESEGRKP